MEIKHKQASFNYELLELYEAGIVLTGSEIKSIREGKANLKGSFCKFMKNELFVFDMFVSKYENQNSFSSVSEKRERKLLLKKKELIKLEKKVAENRLSIIPIKLYLVNNKCKIEIALAKGKKNYDKRNDLKDKDIKKNIERNLSDKY